MKKYKVHMGVRLTQDYYIIAHDEEEAADLAQGLFEMTDYRDMMCADTDTDVWEEDFNDCLADDIAWEEKDEE